MFKSIKRYFKAFDHKAKVRNLADIISSLANTASTHETTPEDARLVSQIRTSERWQTANLDRICLGRGVGRW